MYKFLLFVVLILLAFSCSETQTPTTNECKVGDNQECYSGESTTDGVGECKKGTQTCNTSGNWGLCEGEVLPSVELCDGLDNSCSGVDDDDLATPPVADKSAGVCANQKKACDGVNGWVEPDYTAIIGYEEVEASCDGKDNDCDGTSDNNLTAPNSDKQDGVCKDSKQLCDGINGWKEPDYLSIFSDYERNESICDGLDNDCDGDTDEDLNAPVADKTAGVCANQKKACDGVNGWVEPNYTSIIGYEETEISCDNKDNDCDGTTDEGCDCTDGDSRDCGSEIGECSFGNQTCTNGVWGDCIGGIVSILETCDGLDNDCNGVSDDNLSPPDADKTAGVCIGAVKECKGNQGWKEPVYSDIPHYELDADSCDDRDNDCNGVIDDGHPNNDGDTQADCVDTDDDNDTVLDTDDNCQFTYNTDQANHDDDTMGDACDEDDDNDGVLDYNDDGTDLDNCRIFTNGANEDNQADFDSDGFGDACDECKDDATKSLVGLCGCGIADTDTDGDTIEDCHDNCIYTPNTDQVNADDDSKGDACDMCGDGTEPEEVCNGMDDDCNGVIDEAGVCDSACTREEYEGHVYLFCDEEVNWFEAENKCNSMNYTLVKIEDADENTWIFNQKTSLLSSNDIFIGLNDLSLEGNYRWNYESAGYLYSNWETPNQPDNAGGNENCIEMRTQGTWNDWICTSKNLAYVCENNTPTYFKSCKEILDNGFSVGDGLYTINPDTTNSFEVYCDMTTDGGGWTLVMKTNGDATFKYTSTYWTVNNTYNETDTSLNIANVKYNTFNLLKVTKMRGNMDSFDFYKDFDGTKTALEIFQGVSDTVAGHPGIKSSWSVQPYCKNFGVNTPWQYRRARLGYVSNQENDCSSLDTAIGFGLGPLGSVNPDEEHGSGEMCLSSGCSNGTVNYSHPGTLWVK